MAESNGVFSHPTQRKRSYENGQCQKNGYLTHLALSGEEGWAKSMLLVKIGGTRLVFGGSVAE